MGPAVAAILLVLQSAPGRAAEPLPPELARIDSLTRAGRGAEVAALADSLVSYARVSGKVALERAALLRRVGILLYSERRPAAALTDIARAESLARAARDTAQWRTAVRFEATAWQALYRFDRAVPAFLQLELLARRTGAKEDEGNAAAGLGYVDLEGGRNRSARARYRRAVACLAGTKNRFNWLQARIGLARAHAEITSPDSARAIYLEVIAEAQSLGLWTLEAFAYNNLAADEWKRGDPARAAGYWEHSVMLARRRGALDDIMVPLMNRAYALMAIGRVNEGAGALELAVDSLWDVASTHERAMALTTLALARRRQGLPHQAEALYRRALEMGDSLSFDTMDNAVDDLASSLLELNDAPGAFAAIEQARARRGSRPEDHGRLGAFGEAEALLKLGRPREALAIVLPAGRAGAPRPRALGSIRLDLIEIRALMALGDFRGARTAARLAVTDWERIRSSSRDPEWREARGRSQELVLLLAALALDDSAGTPASRARAAFDAVQPLRARTLAERMNGTSEVTGLPTAIRADTLQQRVLRAAEVYIEFHAGDDSTLVFTITPRAFRVAWIPGRADLSARVARLIGLIIPPGPAEPGSDPVTIEAAARGLGQTLFEGASDLLAGARRVIVSPDGPLCAVPFGLLGVRGIEGPLLARAEVCLVPSAAILERARRLAGSSLPAQPRLLAVAGAADGAGRSLPGAARELEWLERRFWNVTTCQASAAGAVRELAAACASAEIVHVAAHTVVDEAAPWRSAIVLTAAPHEVLWRARDVARLHLSSRLAVLAGCRTLGTRSAFGEGPAGLATGFLAAGVPSTVATLWEVDDEQVRKFVQAFYVRLARGLTAGAALRESQLELRQDPAGRNPFVWAAFTLMGAPELRVALAVRGRP